MPYGYAYEIPTASTSASLSGTGARSQVAPKKNVQANRPTVKRIGKLTKLKLERPTQNVNQDSGFW